MIKPKLDFVAVGPFKTGTSWMHTYLSHHQKVCLPTTVKETYFFNRQNVYDKGIDWYFGNFNLTDSTKLFGEFAPAYFTSNEATARIYQLNPECKIIISLREPISQLISFYLHKLSEGELKTNTTFKEALNLKTDLLDNVLYYTHTNKWVKAFGRDNVKIIFYDLLVQNPQKFANKLCESIGVKTLTVPEKCNRRIGGRVTAVNSRFNKRIKQISRTFRQLDLHWLVNSIKKTGITKLMYKRMKTSYQPSLAEIEYAFNLIEKEIEKSEKSFGLDFEKWEKAWQSYGLKTSHYS